MLTKYGHISPRTAAEASKKLLERGKAELITEPYGVFDPQPKKKSLFRKWRRYHSLLRATAPLSEGIPPAGQRLNHTDYTCELKQYGDLVEITDVVQDTHEDPVLNQAVELCGEQAGETVEVVRIAVLKGGSNVTYANGETSRGNVAATVQRGDLRKIERAFNRAKAKRITQIIKAGHRVATEPIPPSFIGMCHTDLIADVEDLAGYVPYEKYADSSKQLPAEFGRVGSIRFCATPLFEPWEEVGGSSADLLSGGSAPSAASDCDVYPIIIVARNSYGITPLGAQKGNPEPVTPTVLNPQKPDKSDPMGQRGIVSWKTYQGAAILCQTWIMRYEVGCSADPS